MYYIVIYDKVTKEIYRVVEKTDNIVCIGYSDNCMQAITNVKPEGHIWRGSV